MQRRDLTDWSLTAVTLLALIDAVLVPPLGEMGVISQTVADAVFVSVLALGAWLLFDRTSLGKVFIAIATVCVVLRISAAISPAWAVPVAEIWAATLTLFLMSGLLLMYTFAPGSINMHRVAGGVGGYLLLGLAFAQLHRLVAMQWDGAYLVLGAAATLEQMHWRLNYFSFVVLTTLGFGDITPAHAVAKSLATLQAMVGVLYPVLLLGWLVSHARPDLEHRD
jgi:hypothetical protein